MTAPHRFFALLALWAVIFWSGCSDDIDAEADADDTIEIPDVDPPDIVDEEDAEELDVSDVSQDTDAGQEQSPTAVELDFDEHFDAPGEGSVRAIQAEGAEDLIDGEIS